jgi:hypothetical protein
VNTKQKTCKKWKEKLRSGWGFRTNFIHLGGKMTKRVLTPGCKDWSVIQMQRATLFAESVVVFVDSEKLWCAVSSPLSLSSVDVDDTDLRQKEGPVISFPLYRCCPDAVSIPLYSLVSCTAQFTQTKHSIDMIPHMFQTPCCKTWRQRMYEIPCQWENHWLASAESTKRASCTKL